MWLKLSIVFFVDSSEALERPFGATEKIESKYYPIHIGEREVRTLEGEAYTFFNHADSWYDNHEVIKDGIVKLASISKSLGIPRIGIIGTPNLQHFGAGDTEMNIASHGGEHRLQFPNAKTFILAGGYFNNCLCDVFRDAITDS